MDLVQLAASPAAGDRSGGEIPVTGALSTATGSVGGWRPLSDTIFLAAGDASWNIHDTGAPIPPTAAISSSSPAGRTPAAPSEPAPAGAPGCTGGTASTASSNGTGSAAVLTPAGQHIVPALASFALRGQIAALPNRAFEPGFSPA